MSASFDRDATSLRVSPAHLEISANEYASRSSRVAYVEEVDVVIPSALEVDLDFNVKAITESDGVIVRLSTLKQIAKSAS